MKMCCNTRETVLAHVKSFGPSASHTGFRRDGQSNYFTPEVFYCI